MHVREGGENRKLNRHMRSILSTKTTTTTTTTTTTIVAPAIDSNASYLFKDGRKISIGDSALFKPAKDSPPFVGIIRSWISEKESNLTLRVNWLYRPAEIKLLKGVALEAAPNEVFYSFHSDEIPASSLLHPCKVVFLPKGVELPPGLSSFVCRRVYDITSKCLWWLTDQDYINDRQEEVDQLLNKTRKEMHASVEQKQSPRSPRPVNGSAATSPLKNSPDSVQNSCSNLSSQRKGKKRERADQSFDAIKREKSSRPDDGDSVLLRSESMLNSEIAKFTDKGLVDSEAVVRVVQLMQPEKSEKKIDLTGRSMVAAIIIATDNLDCLNQFVQLRGLDVINEWLQEIHKGKIGDLGNLKHGDKSVDDFLLVLLHALNKLPVNLNALQMCNIGKSVNHLRSHKNSEIQKKARSLVDTWKKRVEAEMSINEVKHGSSQAVPLPGRSQHDNSHIGNKHSSGSDAAIRSSITHHSSLKSSSVKLYPGVSNSKPVSAHPGGAKSTLSPTSATDNCKDGQARITANGGNPEPQSAPREEKSSSSSHSHSNSQCSSDLAKNMALCGKEDIRRSTAGSRSLNKTVGGSSKHRNHANGSFSSIHRETASISSSSVPKNAVVEKLSHTSNDTSISESNNHKLIVKISNRGRGPGQSITGGGLEDSSCRNSRAFSPGLSEKRDQSDVSVRGNKHDSHQFHEVDGSSNFVHQSAHEVKRVPIVSKISCSPSRNENKSRKVHDSSFSSMNALIESCAKLSEANMPISAGDDVGMNLLASVAAGEIPKAGIVSPAVSPHRNSKMVKKSSSNHVGNQKQLQGDDVQQSQSTDIAGTDNHINVAGVSKTEGESSKPCGTKSENQGVDGFLKNNGMLEEKGSTASLPVSVTCTTERSMCDLGSETTSRKVMAAKQESQNDLSVVNQGLSVSSEVEDKVKVASLHDEFEKKVHKENALCPSTDDDEKVNASRGLQSNIAVDQQTIAASLKFGSMTTNEMPVMVSPGTGQLLAAVVSNDIKPEGVVLSDLGSQAGNRVLDKVSASSSVNGKLVEPGVCCADIDQDRRCKDQNSDNIDAPSQPSGISTTRVNCSAVAFPEPELHSAADGTKLISTEKECSDNSESPASGVPDMDTKFGFDLNEGFNVDDGKNDEPLNLGSGASSDIVCSRSPFQIPVSSASCGLPASVTVAAAAKGPFPSDDLLWNKRELGWTGSAATSAFRPAEPRKVIPPDASACGSARFPLDIDLNVADESSAQEFNVRDNSICELMTTASIRSSGGLDLDLNKVDEALDMTHGGRHMPSNIQRFEVSNQYLKPSTSNIFSNGATSGKRDFDLNDGPATEELPAEQIPSRLLNSGNIPLQPAFGPRVNSSDTGNCFSWYPPGTSYSLSMTPSVLPDREAFSIVGIGGGSQRIVGGPNTALSFIPDAYSGSVLSSSPALPFHSAPFQYPVLPFGTSFPLPTSALAGGSSGYMDPIAGGRISAIPSQLVGNTTAVSFQYPHAYVVSRPSIDTGNNGAIANNVGNHKWGKQALDLNSGPGVLDMDGRDESLPIVSKQVSISSQSLSEEQARMYSMGGGPGGHIKRKEPEGGWNMDKLNFKQSSWR